MSQLKPTFLRFPPSGSPDVETYLLYVEEAPKRVTYGSPSFNVGNRVVSNQVEVNLASIVGFPSKDTVYNLGVVAKDDYGNLSSMSKLDDIPLDFAAPDPPGKLSISS